MIRKNQKWLNLINMTADALILFLSYFIALWTRFHVMNGSWGQNLLSTEYVVLVGSYSICMVIIFLGCQLYGSFRYKSIGAEGLTILSANGVGVLAVMSLGYLTRWIEFPRVALLLYWLVSCLLLILKRYSVRTVLRHYRALGYNQKFVVVVGNGKLAHQYIKDIQQQSWLGITVVGYVSAVPREELGICLGPYEKLKDILDAHSVDEVVIALEPNETQYMQGVITDADRTGTRISIIPFYNEYIPAKPSIDVIGDTKIINMRATPLDRIGWAAIKRITDILGSLFFIILLSPLMLAIAIGVKITSPGPILFKQERVGKDKKVFKMLKFRSMKIVDMKDTKDTAWSVDDDPRKTKFGSFIRKCSIDELPQFFNVLKGDMSIIGPRPEIPFHVNHFKEEIPLYLVRQQVRPGITGWAQVNGYRGDTSIEERVKHDIWYIENWSVGLDLLIVWKTVFGGMINKEKTVK